MRLTAIVGFGVFCSWGLLLSLAASSSVAGKEQKPTASHVQIQKSEPRAADVSSIDGMILAYYQVVSGPAGQPRDWSRDSTLYIPGVRFVMIHTGKNGKTMAQSMSHQEFVDASDREMVEKGFYEHEVHRITHRAGHLAHIFSASEQRLSPDGPVQGRSVDSLELYWDGTRWWIASANIWEVGSGESLPSEFLPK